MLGRDKELDKFSSKYTNIRVNKSEMQPCSLATLYTRVYLALVQMKVRWRQTHARQTEGQYRHSARLGVSAVGKVEQFINTFPKYANSDSDC